MIFQFWRKLWSWLDIRSEPVQILSHLPKTAQIFVSVSKVFNVSVLCVRVLWASVQCPVSQNSESLMSESSVSESSVSKYNVPFTSVCESCVSVFSVSESVQCISVQCVRVQCASVQCVSVYCVKVQCLIFQCVRVQCLNVLGLSLYDGHWNFPFWLRQELKKSQCACVRSSVCPFGPNLSIALNLHLSHK